MCTYEYGPAATTYGELTKDPSNRPPPLPATPEKRDDPQI